MVAVLVAPHLVDQVAVVAEVQVVGEGVLVGWGQVARGCGEPFSIEPRACLHIAVPPAVGAVAQEVLVGQGQRQAHQG